MIGPLMLVAGLLGLWALARGKAGPVIDAIVGVGGFSTSLDNSLGNMQLGGSGNGGGSSGSSSKVDSSGGTADIGSHSALVNGVVVTIDKTYAQMSDAEKGAANDFAKKVGNVG